MEEEHEMANVPYKVAIGSSCTVWMAQDWPWL